MSGEGIQRDTRGFRRKEQRESSPCFNLNGGKPLVPYQTSDSSGL